MNHNIEHHDDPHIERFADRGEVDLEERRRRPTTRTDERGAMAPVGNELKMTAIDNAEFTEALNALFSSPSSDED
jgi:hypothetical protein